MAAAAVAKQAAELQAAIGLPTQEDMVIDNAAAPPTASGETEVLATPDTPPQS